MYTPLLSPIHATCPAHLILLDLITWTVLGEEYRSLSSSSCSFLHSPVTSYLLGPNFLHSTLFSKTLSLCSSRRATKFHTHTKRKVKCMQTHYKQNVLLSLYIRLENWRSALHVFSCLCISCIYFYNADSRWVVRPSICLLSSVRLHSFQGNALHEFGKQQFSKLTKYMWHWIWMLFFSHMLGLTSLLTRPTPLNFYFGQLTTTKF